MDETSKLERGVELLQQLGLKEYEAKCFVALSRLPSATAKQIAEVSEVPRTRVYDAVRVLETKGLVEKQHSNPQQFRSVTVDEAARTLRDEFEARTDDLRTTLEGIEPADQDANGEGSHQVWSLTGSAGIATRTRQLLDEADEEIVLVIGDEALFENELLDHLGEADDRGVDVIVGTVANPIRDLVADRLPEARVFVSGLEWLEGDVDEDVGIGRILLVDRETLLVSSIQHENGQFSEQAVFGRGFRNGLVVIVRRLMATGLLSHEDPGVDRA